MAAVPTPIELCFDSLVDCVILGPVTEPVNEILVSQPFLPFNVLRPP